MEKKKYILSIFILLIGIFTLSLTKVEAATGTVTISSNKSQIVVGNYVTYTVKVSASKPLGVFQYHISYDSSMLSLESGESSGAPVFTGTEKSKTYTFKFKAKKSGTATVKFNVSGGYTFDQETLSLASKSKSVKIITQAQLEASYSKNNNLSKLGVEGYNLSPSFSSSVTSYTVNLPANTESIKVTGTKADSSASIEGLGTKNVEDGSNTIKIVVTAENGSTKTYTINAIVEELDPINVIVDDINYTFIRKAKLLEAPNSDFTSSTTKIGEHDVPTLFNEKANLTLVGLKDTEGNINLFIYENNTYTKYNQYTFDKITLHILDKEIANYEKIEEIELANTNIVFIPKEENNKITTYTLKNDKYNYFYALNLETGKENLYRFDKEENTVQRYEIVEEEPVIFDNEEQEMYQYIIIGLLAFIFLTYLILLINLLLKGTKKKEKKIKKELDIVQIKEEELSGEEQEIHEEIERIGTQELQLRDLQKNKDSKVSSLEKEKYKKDAEEELKRIKEEKTKDNNEVNEIINELFEDEDKTKEEKKKKRKSNSKGKNKKRNKKD